MSNKRDSPGTFKVGVGCFDGDSNNQVWGDWALVTLAAGASQTVTLQSSVFGPLDDPANTTFRVIGAQSFHPEAPA